MKGIEWVEVSIDKLDGLRQRAEARRLDDGDYDLIVKMTVTIRALAQAIFEKTLSIRRLLRLFFGRRTEKAKNIVGSAQSEGSKPQGTQTENPSVPAKDESQEEHLGQKGAKKLKGHGRNGIEAYTGAERRKVPHPTLRPGDRCPYCPKGKVYPMPPGVYVRFTAKAPIQADITEYEKLRCNCCGQIFAPETPNGAGDKKYDETVGSMIAVLKYGSGFPFNRIEKLQQALGIPLPSSTQWGIVNQMAAIVVAAYHELIRQGAQGEILHNDDTTMKVLSMMKKAEDEAPQDEDTKSRTGMFTTGILSVSGDRKIALFFTGRKHAGENLGELLKKRAAGLPTPIQMCDGLSRNLTKEFETILSNCLTHARRGFADVVVIFPEECRHVIETLGKVYHNDSLAKEQGLSPEERLEFHQTHSGPLMEELKIWLEAKLNEKSVEPNSSLGNAMSYMLKRWKLLTVFLRVPNAPLDNNLCELILKRAILHRKNALFYKTQHGASVGDLFMSLIHTCSLCDANPFDYLTALQRHHCDVTRNPSIWMPWNYKVKLSAIAQACPSRGNPGSNDPHLPESAPTTSP